MSFVDDDQVKEIPQRCGAVLGFVAVLHVLLNEGVGTDYAALEYSAGKSAFILQADVLAGDFYLLEFFVIGHVVIVPETYLAVGGQVVIGEKFIHLGAAGGNDQHGHRFELLLGAVMSFVGASLDEAVNEVVLAAAHTCVEQTESVWLNVVDVAYGVRKSLIPI